MRKHRNHEETSIDTLRLWTYSETVKAVPYLRAVVRSLREHWLEMQRTQLQLLRMDARPGRPERQALVLREEIARECEQAQGDFEDALRDLHDLSVYCLDPAQGVALIPFAQGENLSWFVFDLFATQGVESWRFHSDPLDMRRPLEEKGVPTLAAANVDRVMSQGGQISWSS